MSKAVELNESNYVDFTKEGKSYVQVWSEKCGWCDKQKPVSEKVVEELDVKFGTFHLNYYDPKPSEFRRLYMEGQPKAPVLLVFKDGGLVGRSYKALLSEGILKKFIENPHIEEAPKPAPVTVESLKARGFDLIRIGERAKMELQQINAQIEQMEANRA